MTLCVPAMIQTPATKLWPQLITLKIELGLRAIVRVRLPLEYASDCHAA